MNDYYGLPTGRLENDLIAVDYLTEAGPRVVRLIPKALGENLLAEIPDAVLPSPHGPYHLYGGHRLWHAPEQSARTYVPEEGGLTARYRAGRREADARRTDYRRAQDPAGQAPPDRDGCAVVSPADEHEPLAHRAGAVGHHA